MTQLPGEASLAATLLGWQWLWDGGSLTDAALISNVMHLDIDTEGEPGELLTLRAERDRYREALERIAAMRLHLAARAVGVAQEAISHE